MTIQLCDWFKTIFLLTDSILLRGEIPLSTLDAWISSKKAIQYHNLRKKFITETFKIGFFPKTVLKIYRYYTILMYTYPVKKFIWNTLYSNIFIYFYTKIHISHCRAEVVRISSLILWIPNFESKAIFSRIPGSNWHHLIVRFTKYDLEIPKLEKKFATEPFNHLLPVVKLPQNDM